MLRRSQTQLLDAMALRALGQQVHHLTAGTADPVDGFLAVAVTEHLDPLDQSGLARPFRDRDRGLEFSRRNPSRRDLYPIDLDVDE